MPMHSLMLRSTFFAVSFWFGQTTSLGKGRLLSAASRRWIYSHHYLHPYSSWHSLYPQCAHGIHLTRRRRWLEESKCGFPGDIMLRSPLNHDMCAKIDEDDPHTSECWLKSHLSYKPGINLWCPALFIMGDRVLVAASSPDKIAKDAGNSVSSYFSLFLSSTLLRNKEGQ